MILESEIVKIGTLIKPHGIKGEVVFAFDNDVFSKADCPYLICLVDQIYVPFFIKEYRFKGQNTALIIFEDVNTEEQARRMSGLNVFYPKEYLLDDDNDIEYGWKFFVGFNVNDSELGNLGIIEDVDELTMNTLFLIKDTEGNDLIIPASEDFILEIDNDSRTLFMKLPEGLISVE